jgi:hypothetical protein
MRRIDISSSPAMGGMVLRRPERKLITALQFRHRSCGNLQIGAHTMLALGVNRPGSLVSAG